MCAASTQPRAHARATGFTESIFLDNCAKRQSMISSEEIRHPMAKERQRDLS